MTSLIAGLVIFLGMHSIRVVGEGPRAALIARIGEMAYKGAYGIVSLVGLVLIGRGYGEALAASGSLYIPLPGLRVATLVLVPIAFVLAAAAYVPAGYIKRAVRHPMVLGVGLWALAHLLANGETANVVLFGGFLLWAIADYAASIGRNPQPVGLNAASVTGDIIAITVGIGATLAFVLWLHRWFFGVSPIG